MDREQRAARRVGCDGAGRRERRGCPCHAAVLPATRPTPEMLTWSRDLQMFLSGTFEKHWLPRIGICFACTWGLPWKSGQGGCEQCHKGLYPLAGLPRAIRSAERARLWLVGFVYSADATLSFINNAVVPSSAYIMVSICSGDRADHLSSLSRLTTSPGFALPHSSESCCNLTLWLVKHIVELQLAASRGGRSSAGLPLPRPSPPHASVSLPWESGSEAGWEEAVQDHASSSCTDSRRRRGELDLRAGTRLRAPCLRQSLKYPHQAT